MASVLFAPVKGHVMMSLISFDSEIDQVCMRIPDH